MLDTGHLMNTNWKIGSQCQGIRYILKMIEKHGELSNRICGLHFHQSMSGAYCRKTIGPLPENFPLEYYDEFSRNYAHILQIDRHRPWSDEACVMILERVQPKYLTHEISGSVYRGRVSAIRNQMRVIGRGYMFDYHKLTVSELERRREEAKHKPEPTGNWFLDYVVRGL